MRSLIIVVLAGCASCERAEPPLAPPSPESIFGPQIPAALEAALDTDRGTIRCTLHPTRAPRAAALVVGLARGRARWREPSRGGRDPSRAGQVTTRPFYDGLTFHRRIPGVLAQTGCPIGDGTGTPGYRIPLERHPTDRERLARAGALVLATYTPPPGRTDPSPPPPGDVVGSQLAITFRPMPHLLDHVTVLGTCRDLPPTPPTRLLHLGTGSR